jgi:hypothetical protein
MSATDDRVIHFALDLSRGSPAIDALRRKQLRSYGEVLDHLLLADVTRHVLELADQAPGAEDANVELHRILGTLEAWYDSNDPAQSGGDDPVSNAIALSFLFNLPPPDARNPVVDLLGPKLSRSYDRFWTDGTFG